MRRIEISLGGRCNTACIFCPTTYLGEKPALTLNEIAAKLQSYKAEGYDEVIFTGGEPTIRREIVHVISLAKRTGYARIGIYTNLLMLSYGAFVDKLVAAGMNCVSFSIYAAENEAYAELTKVEASFSLVRKALGNLQGRGLACSAFLLITSKSAEMLGKMAELAAWVTPDEINFDYISTSELPPDQKGLSARFSDVLPHLSEAVSKVMAKTPAIKILRIPPCALGRLSDLYHNERMDDIIVVDNGCDFHVSKESLAVMVKMERCNGCSSYGICPGIIKDYFDRFGGEELEPTR